MIVARYIAHYLNTLLCMTVIMVELSTTRDDAGTVMEAKKSAVDLLWEIRQATQLCPNARRKYDKALVKWRDALCCEGGERLLVLLRRNLGLKTSKPSWMQV